MTQTEEKKNSEDLEPDDPKAEETLEELANGELVGVHVLSEEDMKKHFGPSDKDHDGDRDRQESES